jgi:hypothetical protein
VEVDRAMEGGEGAKRQQEEERRRQRQGGEERWQAETAIRTS